MNYKETLFFIGKCLTINQETHNKKIVEKKLQEGTVDWDNVVKVSTAQLVFPALYCNLKRANFLTYLPEDLVSYMKYITDLNRERNQQLIYQAKQINQLLLANNIAPVFLKGTGNLLEGLYEDIGERMVGDIDFLVSKENFNKTIELLDKDGYNPIGETKNVTPHRHYSRLVKENNIAAVEIHHAMLKEPENKIFNYENISSSILSTQNKEYILSYKHQTVLTVLAHQINDCGYYNYYFSLKAMYDSFLQLNNCNETLLSIINENKSFVSEINVFMTTLSWFLNIPERIKITPNSEIQEYISRIEFNIDNPAKAKKFYKNRKRNIFLKTRFLILKKTFSNKAYRNFLIFNVLLNPKWYKRKLFKLKS